MISTIALHIVLQSAIKQHSGILHKPTVFLHSHKLYSALHQIQKWNKIYNENNEWKITNAQNWVAAED